MTERMITGGYYLKARKIQKSEIAQAPPHVREIWDWLLMNVNHKDNQVAGRLIKRGQRLCTYKDILDGLSWKVGYRTKRYSKIQCEFAMKFLRRGGMITTTKTTRGMIITVCKYDFYQNPKNYESHNESHNESHDSPQHRHTINKNGKNDNKKKEFLPGCAALELYSLMISDIEKRGHHWRKGAKPNPQKWALVFDRMIRLDGCTAEEIKESWSWVNLDKGNGKSDWPGWSGVIFSPESLRDNYDKILIQKKQGEARHGGCRIVPGEKIGELHCLTHGYIYEPSSKEAEGKCPGAVK